MYEFLYFIKILIIILTLPGWFLEEFFFYLKPSFPQRYLHQEATIFLALDSLPPWESRFPLRHFSLPRERRFPQMDFPPKRQQQILFPISYGACSPDFSRVLASAKSSAVRSGLLGTLVTSPQAYQVHIRASLHYLSSHARCTSQLLAAPDQNSVATKDTEREFASSAGCEAAALYPAPC